MLLQSLLLLHSPSGPPLELLDDELLDDELLEDDELPEPVTSVHLALVPPLFWQRQTWLVGLHFKTDQPGCKLSL